MNKILIIQTAYLGDVILATSLVETIHAERPATKIHVLLRKGNEGILVGNPHVEKVHIWDKQRAKYSHLIRIASQIRKEQFDAVFNLQRFASAGFIAWRSRAKVRVGFAGNFFASFLTHKVEHDVDSGLHEIDRNFLLASRGDVNLKKLVGPKLFPSDADVQKVRTICTGEFYVMAPASVWFTKQLPEKKWVELILAKPENSPVLLIGSAADRPLIDRIITATGRSNVQNLAGQLTVLESAALMAGAKRNYVNDSGPLHIASAMNAPVTAFFCSTVPSFGFGPLSQDAVIAEVKEKLSCRPCGIHGYKACPEGHFRCGSDISISQF